MDGIRFDGKLDYIIDNISYVNVTRNNGWFVPYREGKPLHGIILVEEGKMNYHFIKTNENIALKKGSIIFIPKNTPYEAEYIQDGTTAKVFSFDIISKDLPDIFKSYFTKEHSTYMEICKNINGLKASSSIYLAAKIYELLYTIEKESSLLPPRFKGLLPAITEIHHNYNKNEKILYYAELCHMSESNFRKLFKEYSGKSLIEYRNLLRISEAKRMIDSGEFTVIEAAYHTGFNNMSFFYEVYNRNFPKK